jgi:hypothetical protein
MAKIKKGKQNGRLTEASPIAGSRQQKTAKTGLGYSGKLLAAGTRSWLIVGVIALITLGTLGAGLKYLEEDANRQTANGQLTDGSQKTSLLNTINPFISNPTPTPTPQLSKEYIYAGGKMLAVEDANANAAPPTDLAFWRPSNGYWYVLGGQGSQQTSVQWGQSGDKTVPGDYDGDGKTDFSVFRPGTSSGTWYIQNSSNGGLTAYTFGAQDDLPAPADYDGDGRTDAAVFRQSNGTWYIQRSSDSGLTAIQFGLGTDVPAPGDFDGDGKADLAVWRGTSASFYILRSSDNGFQGIAFGANGDTPVPADYDGDGRADAAVWRNASWNILYSSTGASQTFTFGDPNSDKAVHNDYDGDGKVDVAIWRPSNGRWYILQSSKVGQPDYQREVQWGQNGDIPVPAFYRR